MMLKVILIVSFISIFSACSSINKSLSITNVDVLAQGANKKERPEMESVCKGFLLTSGQVINFYNTATRIYDKTLPKRFNILPCYSSGVAYLYGIKYNWRIRSGGFGEFYNKENHIFKICGTKCCNKVTGIC